MIALLDTAANVAGTLGLLAGAGIGWWLRGAVGPEAAAAPVERVEDGVAG